MWTKLRTLASLYRELGFRWAAFRVAYALRLRTGLVRLQMAQYQWDDRTLETWLRKDVPSNPEAYARWRKEHLPKFLFDQAVYPENTPWNTQIVTDEANRILSGEMKYFAHDFVRTGFPPNWHHDYVTGLDSDSYKHWSQISDDANSDIKFLWEPNRFAFVYTLVRAYTASHHEKYPEAFWALIHFWEKYNPPNTGPNWMDGQEIALRLMAWMFGYQAFIDSPSSTPERKEQFTLYVAAQTERIYKNIGYAISTRSNHTISEAFGLWLVGLLFPELKDSERYFSFGRKLLEQEASAQIFPDGTYSMYSLNYQRFILHIYLYAIRLGEINGLPFSSQLKSSVSKSIDYLSHLINPQTGQMPVYGSNDGALVLPLNNCDFTDYRPLLQLGWYTTKQEFLFEPGPWDEDVFWICGISRAEQSASAVEAQNSKIAFPHGGTYILRGHNSKAIIRCMDYTSRPSHADQLHVDLWIHGHNIAIDAGTYLYSGKGIWRNGLARTSAHNTVTVDHKDQMTMVSRFTWTNLSKGKVLKHGKDFWQGEHDSYYPVSHKRKVMSLEGDRWLVIDDLDADEPHQYSLHWLLNDVPFTEYKNSIHMKYESHTYKVETGLVDGDGSFTIVRADPNSTRGWRSRYYGDKEPAISLLLEAYQSNARFWTFFGLEEDEIALSRQGMQINGVEVDFD